MKKYGFRKNSKNQLTLTAYVFSGLIAINGIINAVFAVEKPVTSKTETSKVETSKTGDHIIVSAIH